MYHPPASPMGQQCSSLLGPSDASAQEASDAQRARLKASGSTDAQRARIQELERRNAQLAASSGGPTDAQLKRIQQLERKNADFATKLAATEAKNQRLVTQRSSAQQTTAQMQALQQKSALCGSRVATLEAEKDALGKTASDKGTQLQSLRAQLEAHGRDVALLKNTVPKDSDYTTYWSQEANLEQRILRLMTIIPVPFKLSNQTTTIPMLNFRKADIRILHLPAAFYWNFGIRSSWSSSTITVKMVFEQASNNQKLSLTSLERTETNVNANRIGFSNDFLNLTLEANGTSVVKAMTYTVAQVELGDFMVFQNPLHIVCKSSNAAAIQELQVKISGDLTSNDCFVYRQEPT